MLARHIFISVYIFEIKKIPLLRPAVGISSGEGREEIIRKNRFNIILIKYKINRRLLVRRGSVAPFPPLVYTPLVVLPSA